MASQMKITKNIKKYFYFLIGVFPFVFVTIFSMLQIHAQHFSALAQSFLQGKLYFLTSIAKGYDAVLVHGNYYWPLGPFPAVLLMPFVGIASLIGIPMYEAYLHIVLLVCIFMLVYRIAKQLHYTKSDSLFLAYALCFGSVMMSVALDPMSYHFSHFVVVFLLFLCIYEYSTRRRLPMLGVLMGMVLATRLTAGFGIIFFIMEIISRHVNKGQKVKQLTMLLLPYMSIIFLLALYNFARFGSPLEQGYNMQIVTDKALLTARSYGTFSLTHLPGNLYYFILATPQPVFRDGISHVLTFPFIQIDHWGLSIFVTSPYLVYLFFLRYRDKLSQLLWFTSIIIAIPIFFYYGIGYWQLGYRYALDFYPWIFWLFIKNYKEQFHALTFRLRLLIIVAILTNFYLYLFGTPV
jgi:hypothetical protein